MKIFYAVQATGNGHISRAMELLPFLQQYGQVDIFLSGNNSSLEIDAPIKFRHKGLSLYYNCNGTLDYWKIAKSINYFSLKKVIKELPVEKYDLIINDYDFITAKACAAKNIKSINFGHQASFQSANAPRPEKRSTTGEWMLTNFAKASNYLGLHFENYDDFIITPVIKKQILDAYPKDEGHITVYLPSYCEQQLISSFSIFKKHRFEIFSHESFHINQKDNIKFIPVDKLLFNKSLINCSAIITGGGFETPAEAIHMGKKILSIPIRGQYEQLCNAAALKQMGIMTLASVGDIQNHFIRWIEDYKPVQKDYSKSVDLCMKQLFETNPF